MDIGRLILVQAKRAFGGGFSSLMDIGRLILVSPSPRRRSCFSSLMDIGRLILNTSVLILMYVLVL